MAVLGVAALLAPVGGLSAHASVGTPVVYQDQKYASGAGAASADKPQSKLWYADGSWWALMATTGSTVNIWRLQANHTWANTGTVVDNRISSTGDALYVNSTKQLYVASRTAGSSGQIRVYRFSYNATSDVYSLDPGFPVAPGGAGGSESVTIDRDGTNTLWITFTRGSKVYVSHSRASQTDWTQPFRPQNTSGTLDTAVSSDDISALVQLNGSIGLMWSDQTSNVFHFAVHPDGAADNAWGNDERPLEGTRMADDHINLKSLIAASDGRLYAAVKTSQGDAGEPPTSPVIIVLSRGSAGGWAEPAVGATLADKMTRPQIALDTTNNLLWLMQSTEGGGTVYYKTSSTAGPISFGNGGAGKGSTFIQWSGAKINNVSTTKDPVTSTTGLVAIASDQFALRYYHAEVSLG